MAVAAGSMEFSTIDDTSLTCDAACTADGGKKCVAGFIIDRSFQGSPSVVVMRSLVSCSASGGSYTLQCICYE
jgi:hypothetical protein